MRICTKCKRECELSDFCRDAQKRDGIASHCKKCKLDASRKLRGVTPDRHFAYAKKYGSSADRVRAWKLNNPEGYAAAIARRDPLKQGVNHKAWRDKNLAAERERLTKWRATNPSLMAEYAAQRRASKLRATPSWANRLEILQKYIEAKALTQKTGIEHVVDHMVPLRSKKVCGLHVSANLCVVPESVNASKGNRFWPDMP